LKFNLASPSHSLRATTLRILLHLASIVDPSSTTFTQALLEIENTPRNVENIRSTSLAMRKLPVTCPSGLEDMLVAFCFGLLTVNFAPLWTDASGILKAISEHSGVTVWEMAFRRLIENEEDTIDQDDTANHKESGVAIEDHADKIWNENHLSSPACLSLLLAKVLSSWYTLT
jgi:hypothetical protein